MGIKGLKKLVPGQPINLFDYLGCDGQTPRRALVDAANPLFASSVKYPKHAFADDALPSMVELRHLHEHCNSRRLSTIWVFDGAPYEPKANEHARRAVSRLRSVARVEAALDAGN